MKRKLNCIMLIDDNPDDNYFHQRVIRKNDMAAVVVEKQMAQEALDYLKAKDQHPNEHPDLIFLDINMPGMNGWEFLTEYNKMDQYFRSKVVVVMLSTSDDPADILKAKSYGIPFELKTKPLTKEILEEIMNKYF